MKLRRWARQGVRVATAEPLRIAVVKGSLDVMRCLVFELGADVDQGTPFYIGAANKIVAPTLYIAAAYGLLLVVHCLVKELGANINQRSQQGTTAIYFAAGNGHLDVLRFLAHEVGADVNNFAILEPVSLHCSSLLTAAVCMS
jgi:hypothetical protein